MTKARAVLAKAALIGLACIGTGCLSFQTTLSKDFVLPKTVAVVAVVDAEKAKGAFLLTGRSTDFRFDTDLLTDKLTRYLVDQRLYSVVERASVKEALKEMTLNLSELFDDRTAQRKIGELCGADHIVIARASMVSGWLVLPPAWWKYIVLETRAIDVQTATVMWAGHAGGWYLYPFSEDALLETVVESLFSELTADIDAAQLDRAGSQVATGAANTVGR